VTLLFQAYKLLNDSKDIFFSTLQHNNMFSKLLMRKFLAWNDDKQFEKMTLFVSKFENHSDNKQKEIGELSMSFFAISLHQHI